MIPQKKNTPPFTLRLCALAAALFAPSAGASLLAQPTPSPTPYQVDAPQAATEFVVRWAGTPRVTRYRLQVASDPRFRDIVFDGAVVGLEYKVTGLPPGRYYWRVAPAPKETGRFSVGEVIEVLSSESLVLRSPRHIGWHTAIGRVQRPVPARLRSGQPVDLVAVNSEGTIYALEGATGAALWSAHFRPAARRGEKSQDAPREIFTPVVYPVPRRDVSNVLAAFDGGVRMLEGETGRELWRVSTTGRPESGTVAEMDGNPEAPELVVATNEPSQLYVIEGAGGRVISQTKLQGDVIGLPIPFQAGEMRGVILAMEGGHLDVRQADGSRLRGIRFDVPFVTPPLVIAGPKGTAVIVGTEHGLLFLNGADLTPLGRITTEADSPRGRLAAADLDGDRSLEIVMVTRRGRLAVVSAQGKINWSADGAADAYSASFADLNRDGTTDVLVADEGVFARGFSGRDGRLIWQADDEAQGKSATSVGGDRRALRSLAVAPAGADATLIVSGDPARNSLRAVGMPAVAGRVAAK